jgi:hypothetical protein
MLFIIHLFHGATIGVVALWQAWHPTLGLGP